jgi:hypothetical protein
VYPEVWRYLLRECRIAIPSGSLATSATVLRSSRPEHTFASFFNSRFVPFRVLYFQYHQLWQSVRIRDNTRRQKHSQDSDTCPNDSVEDSSTWPAHDRNYESRFAAIHKNSQSKVAPATEKSPAATISRPKRFIPPISKHVSNLKRGNTQLTKAGSYARCQATNINRRILPAETNLNK